MDSAMANAEDNNKKLIFSDSREEILKIDPIEEFKTWLAGAENHEPNDPNVAAVATVDETGMPNVRMQLLKGLDERGFVFYTNFNSTKAHELEGQPKASLCFHWKSTRQQIRVRGLVEEVSAQEADIYFATRSCGSRLGAWASLQSSELDCRKTLEQRAKEVEAKYEGQDVPRPPHWKGFRINPLSIEFWQDGEFRLHDRVMFQRDSVDGQWDFARYYP